MKRDRRLIAYVPAKKKREAEREAKRLGISLSTLVALSVAAFVERKAKKPPRATVQSTATYKFGDVEWYGDDLVGQVVKP